MPATAVRVVGPNLVDPGFTSTGEKPLLSLPTTFPAGGKNVILVSYAGYTSTSARGTFRIYKGSTILYETRIAGEHLTTTRTRPFHHLLIAVDPTPVGSDSYSFYVNITTAGTATGFVHVQGMVIRADEAVWGYNTAAVNIPAGGTGTVVSINTNFPAGRRVVVIATVYAGAATTTAGEYLIGVGNIKLKAGTTVVSSNRFNIGSYRDVYPLRVSLIYLDTPTSGSQTYSVEITNGSSVAYNCYAEIVAFDVYDAAYLDTAPVAVGTAQTTVGNLVTNLSDEVAVIALAAAERPTTSDGDTFLEDTVVLQMNNSSTGQVGNRVRWYMFRSSTNARSGVLPLFRYDGDVTSPTYQVKMTAAASGVANGKAQILTFTLTPGQSIKRIFGETVRAIEGARLARRRFRLSAESVRLTEARRLVRDIVRNFLESVRLAESAIRTRICSRVVNENEEVSEIISPLGKLFRQVLESLSVSEAVSRVRGHFMTVVESETLSETISRIKIIARMVGEVVRALEVAVRSRIISRLVGEVMHIFEAFSSAKGSVRAIIESLQFSESFQRAKGLAISVVELVRLSELISRTSNFARVLVESMNLPEDFRVVRDRVRHVSESLRISEIDQHIREFVKTFGESLHVPEFAVSFKGAVRVLGEVLNLGEFSRTVRDRFKQVGEHINIGEVLSKHRIVVRTVLESIYMLGGWVISRGKAIAVGEISNIGEALIQFRGKVLDILELVVVTEIRLFKKLKAYIDRLASAIKGMSRSHLSGKARGGRF